jgi:hypothetical protein
MMKRPPSDPNKYLIEPSANNPDEWDIVNPDYDEFDYYQQVSGIETLQEAEEILHAMRSGVCLRDYFKAKERGTC